jgi:hypothetical protein
MLKRVLDQVGEELREESPIAIDLRTLRDLGPERAPTLLDRRSIGLGHRAQHIGEVDQPEGRAAGSAAEQSALPVNRFMRCTCLQARQVTVS